MLRGRVVRDQKTKDLIKRIKPREIALIDHQDIDEIAAQSLIEKQVKAILNSADSISGRYPNTGPAILLKAGIPVIDINTDKAISSLNEGDEVIYDHGVIYRNQTIIAYGTELNLPELEKKLVRARFNQEQELNKFIDNTLQYARREKRIILDLLVPEIGIDFKGKQALIVVRGSDYKDDLAAIKSYILEMNPIIIAVDGGADACLERGYKPDIIIGDMDSVSDLALKKGSKVVVHAYPDGRAPGLKRIKQLGIDYVLFPAPGTSEDIALLLAYEKGAELITAVGTHSHMVDFLEKGRPGMASTLLVRLKVGDRLVDAKGVSKLYQNKIYYHYWVQLVFAILLPLSILGFFSPPLKQLANLLLLRISLLIDLLTLR